MSTGEPRTPFEPLPPIEDLYAEAFEKALAIDRPDLVEELVESIARAVPGVPPRRSHA